MPAAEEMQYHHQTANISDVRLHNGQIVGVHGAPNDVEAPLKLSGGPDPEGDEDDGTTADIMTAAKMALVHLFAWNPTRIGTR